MSHNHEFIKRDIFKIEPSLFDEISTISDDQWTSIGAAFEKFCHSLKSHIQHEDDILYKKVQSHTKANTDFYNLIAEHLQILELLERCQSTFKEDERKEFSNTIVELFNLVEQHSVREEALMNKHSSSLETSSLEIIQELRTLHVH